MNFLKENYKLIIGIIIGAILISGISVYATGQYLASQVDYNKNGQAKVSDALDDLYSKVPSGTKTITEKGNQIDVSKYQYADTTGLYTLSEVQSGKGTNWNYGSFNSETGTKDIITGFRPTEIYFEWYPDSSMRFLYHYNNNKLFLIYYNNGNYGSSDITDMIEIKENGFKIKGWGANYTFSYIAR